MTVHTSRLYQRLIDKQCFDVRFLDIRQMKLSDLQFLIRRNQIIHLHSSNPLFRVCVAVLTMLSQKILVQTIHGDLGRFSFFYNIFDKAAILFSKYIVVLNSHSLTTARKYNKNSFMISSYIAMKNIEHLRKDIRDNIIKCSDKKNIYCTCAHNLTYDKNGKEIYGIVELSLMFETFVDKFLIVSDPSGAYSKYFKINFASLPKNTFFISEPHDFRAVLIISTAFIRNTSTDGDSISIKESLSLKTSVYATQVTDRPLGVNLYTDINDLKSMLVSQNGQVMTLQENISYDGFDEIVGLYEKIFFDNFR